MEYERERESVQGEGIFSHYVEVYFFSLSCSLNFSSVYYEVSTIITVFGKSSWICCIVEVDADLQQQQQRC